MLTFDNSGARNAIEEMQMKLPEKRIEFACHFETL